MKVVVYGGRDFTNKIVAFKAFDLLHKQYNFTLVIDGKARGADTLGNQWAIHNNIPFEREPAQWDKYGKAAGPIRNELMITKYQPDVAIAFPGGVGTSHMTKNVLNMM